MRSKQALGVPRQLSDWTTESSTGWETGDDDDSSTNLDLTDHTIDSLVDDFDKIQVYINKNKPPSFGNSSCKTKLKNPWKQPKEMQHAAMTNTTRESHANEASRRVMKNQKKIPEIVKTASLRGREMFQKAGRDIVRSASKRFSKASREKTVLKPTVKQAKKSQLRTVTQTHCKSFEIKNAKNDMPHKDKNEALSGPRGTRGRSVDPKLKRKDTTAASTKKSSKRAQSANPPLKRKAPQKVPSYLQQMWQQQRKADTRMILQWAVWEVQVDQLIQPPSLQPWVSIDPRQTGVVIAPETTPCTDPACPPS